MAGEAFAVSREALRGKAGIGKLAQYGREYVVAVQPRERGLVMFTLRQADEIRKMSSIDELDEVSDEVNDAEIQLAKQVIGNFQGDLELSEFKDEYQAELRQIIDAKIAGEEVVVSQQEAPANVVDLMDALRKSLDSVSQSKKKAAKATKVGRASARKQKQAETLVSCFSLSSQIERRHLSGIPDQQPSVGEGGDVPRFPINGGRARHFVVPVGRGMDEHQLSVLGQDDQVVAS